MSVGRDAKLFAGRGYPQLSLSDQLSQITQTMELTSLEENPPPYGDKSREVLFFESKASPSAPPFYVSKGTTHIPVSRASSPLPELSKSKQLVFASFFWLLRKKKCMCRINVCQIIRFFTLLPSHISNFFLYLDCHMCVAMLRAVISHRWQIKWKYSEMITP